MHGREDSQCPTQVSRFLHVQLQLQLLGVDGPGDRGQPHDIEVRRYLTPRS